MEAIHLNTMLTPMTTKAQPGSSKKTTAPKAAAMMSAPASKKSASGKTPDKGPAAPKSRLFANYPAAVKNLLERVNFEQSRLTREHRGKFKLDRMRAIMAALENPQDDIRTVHIAGTKGKGSTAAMTASCLEACGYTVGLYTSPHLVELRERIQINGEMITTGEFTRLMDRVATAASKVAGKHGEATFFEMVTALAFVHFAEQAVDIAVIEVGLGGRLDATNVITPEVAVVTSISKDHEQLLGDTLEEIAREKAGVFKKGVPALTIEQPKNIIAALRAAAEEAGTKLEVLGESVDFSYRFESSPDLGPHRRVCVTSPRSSFEHLAVPLPGEHQAFNCGLALAILDRLRERGFETPESKVALGLAQTTIPGRMEMAWKSPRILLDGAHNEASLTALIRSIGAHVPYDSMVMIFGCASDKDVDGLLDKIALGADKLIFTKSSANPRAMNPRELQKRFAAISGKMTQVADTLHEAFNLASRAVSRGDLIVVTGSFYLVGEAKKYLAELEVKRAGARAAAAED